MPFTPEELAAMAAADAEIEANFHLTNEDLARSRALDRYTAFSRLPPEKRKQAAQQKAWYEANRDKYNAYMRDYMRNRRKSQEVTPCSL